MKFIMWLLAFALGCAIFGANLTLGIAGWILFALVMFAFVASVITALASLWDAITGKGRRGDNITKFFSAGFLALLVFFFLRFFF